MTMTKFNIQHSTDRPDRVFVAIDNRFDVALIRIEGGLRIHVFPISDGEVWDDPFERFEVDESEVRALEQEMGHD
jgi:hypothetical protein